MGHNGLTDVSYFPGCSLATSARESNLSLMHVSQVLGLNLIELEDWNCCGSSSAHSLDTRLGINLAVRNLSLAPAHRPLVVICPRCLHQLRQAQLHLGNDPQFRRAQERRYGREISPDLEIIHFLELLVRRGLGDLQKSARRSLNGLKFVPYYGCTLFRPPALRRQKYYQAEMENILSVLGGQAITRAYMHRCCGSFLSAARADIVTPLVNEIIDSAVSAGADCLVTACTMCQLNLEVRCTWELNIPIFHFSEILALALGAEDYETWFARHLVDPRPLLTARGLIS
jgi:heterodisulfide reductase subunit B